MKNLSKKETEEEIKKFFSEIGDKSPEEIKKIKKLSMGHNIKLRESKRKFCKKCFSPYSGKEKIRIRNKIKSVECKNCNYINRWKI